VHALQKQFQDYIDKSISSDEVILLAVSGGVDSMVLATLFLESEINFVVAHCNFQLRGSESDEDEKHVDSWCKKHGIGFFCEKFEIDGSVQLEARNLRYTWFNELLKNEGFDKIATAHHLNDSIETFLLNLTRGTGLQGLVGIREENQNIIRPLIHISKESIKEFADYKEIEWREDLSNAKKDYKRNRIRLDVIPILEDLNSNLVNTFRFTQERLELTSQLIERKVLEVKSQLIVINDSYELNLSWIIDKSDLIVLSELLKGFGFNYHTCKEIWAARKSSGKAFQSIQWVLTVDRDKIFISPNVKKAEEFNFSIASYGNFQFDRYQMTLKRKSEIDTNLFSNPFVGQFDADKLKFPLTTRNWRQGDTFKPLGLHGHKKVSDFLINSKVPLFEKRNVKVLCSNGEIIWLIGHRISEDFKINKRTSAVAEVQFTSLNENGN